MAKRPGNLGRPDLERMRRMLIERAAVERLSLGGATEDMQAAGDRILRVAGMVVLVARRFWVPVAAVALAGLFKRRTVFKSLGPALRLARTGLTIWQVAKLVRSARR